MLPANSVTQVSSSAEWNIHSTSQELRNSSDTDEEEYSFHQGDHQNTNSVHAEADVVNETLIAGDPKFYYALLVRISEAAAYAAFRKLFSNLKQAILLMLLSLCLFLVGSGIYDELKFICRIQMNERRLRFR